MGCPELGDEGEGEGWVSLADMAVKVVPGVPSPYAEVYIPSNEGFTLRP